MARNVKPSRYATVERAKAEVAIVAELARAASQKTGISVTALLASDDFVNRAFAIAQRKVTLS